MYDFYSRHRRLFLSIFDSSVAGFSLYFSFLLRFDLNIPVEWYSIMFTWMPIIIISQFVLFNFSEFYDSIWRYISLFDLILLIKLSAYAFVLSFTILFFYYAGNIVPISVLLIYFLLNTLLIGISRISIRIFFIQLNHNYTAKEKDFEKRLILVGAGFTGEKIAREVVNTKSSGYKIIGFVDDNPNRIKRKIHGYKVLGKVKDLEKFKNQFDEILITTTSATSEQIRSILNECKKTKKLFKTIPSLSEMMNEKISIDNARSVSYLDLLGRPEIHLDKNSVNKFLSRKRILISGAGGSIGSELIRQCLVYNPAEIICIDFNEESIFKLNQEQLKIRSRTIIKPVLVNVLYKKQLEKIFTENRPQIVFHAAAYKHVPIQELHPWHAVKTNIIGTQNIIEISSKFNCEKFVLVSTDKAVNPVNVMGATKRLAEKLIQSKSKVSKTVFCAVRFGNVLGSSGSVIPTFENQIKNGGPITITHPEMTRYFMSIPEAAQLILEAGAIGTQGNIFLLEMGKPIKIDAMARDLIKLSGLEPEIDIPIVYTGLRPGEKLYEELRSRDEVKVSTKNKKIMILDNNQTIVSWTRLKYYTSKLESYSDDMDQDGIQEILKEILPTYQPRDFKSINTNQSISTIQFKAEA